MTKVVSKPIYAQPTIICTVSNSHLTHMAVRPAASIKDTSSVCFNSCFPQLTQTSRGRGRSEYSNVSKQTCGDCRNFVKPNAFPDVQLSVYQVPYWTLIQGYAWAIRAGQNTTSDTHTDTIHLPWQSCRCGDGSQWKRCTSYIMTAVPQMQQHNINGHFILN